ncbi:MAG: CoA-binding protein [Nitrospirae bacterium]|nr:CoA-binding protein [Nitrospirota bacterium]
MDKEVEFEKGRKIMDRYQTIAVVGLSRHPEKPSHYVPRFLQEQGYTLIGVNPFAKGKILGVKVYDRLRDIPDQVEIVQIFRPSEEVPPIVDEAIAIGAKVIWIQEGIIHSGAARKAEQAGLPVVMDLCMMKAFRPHRYFS